MKTLQHTSSKLKLIALVSILCCFSPYCAWAAPFELAKPSPKQIAFADWEVGAVLYYGLSVYTGQKHGDWVAPTPANRFNVEKPYNVNPGFETIGHKKIDRVNPVTTHKIRFRCLEAVTGRAELRQLSVFHCETIKKS